jgi:hypothetical protein
MVEAAVTAVTAVTARVARDSYPRRDNLYSSSFISSLQEILLSNKQ